VFTVTAPLLLQLTKLRIWHDNTGSSPAWYVKKVVVCDTTSSEEYEFPCEKWIRGNFPCELLPTNTANAEGSKQQQRQDDKAANRRT
jgi:hypothetical protein